MIPLESSIDNLQVRLNPLEAIFHKEGFILGGGYEYNHGFFDKALDWEKNNEHHVYLRVPVSAVQGSIGDGKEDTIVQIGQPFVLKHQIQPGSDDGAGTGVISGLVNQFAEPADPDDYVEEKWIQRGTEALQKLEKRIQEELMDK